MEPIIIAIVVVVVILIIWFWTSSPKESILVDVPDDEFIYRNPYGRAYAAPYTSPWWRNRLAWRRRYAYGPRYVRRYGLV